MEIDYSKQGLRKILENYPISEQDTGDQIIGGLKNLYKDAQEFNYTQYCPHLDRYAKFQSDPLVIECQECFDNCHKLTIDKIKK